MAVHTVIIAENPQMSKFLDEMIRVGGLRGGSAPRGGTRRTCSASASGASPASSSGSISNLWVEMTQLDPRISGGKAPLHWLARPIALFRPGADFVA